MSNYSFIDKKNIKNSIFFLDEKESHHVSSVLRLKEDSEIMLTDGQGTVYQGIIKEISKKLISGEIINKNKIQKRKNFKSSNK